MDIVTYIPEELMIVVTVVYVIGLFLKQIPMIPDKFIPIILMASAILFALIVGGFTGASALQGVLCWGVAVGINQTVKQIGKDE